MNNAQKRTLRRIIIEVALLLLLLPLQARAAEYKCTAELPVEVRTSGAATAERFTITLTPEDGAPAPAADTVQVKGSGTAGFTGLTYTAPGDYRYTVRQCAGGTAHMTYDATVYTVTVRVTNQPNGGLGAEIWATGGSSEKTGLLLFQNRKNNRQPHLSLLNASLLSLLLMRVVFVSDGIFLCRDKSDIYKSRCRILNGMLGIRL